MQCTVYSAQSIVYSVQCTVYSVQCTAELYDIYRDATVSDDIGYFERYSNGTYPTWPDHIRLIIN